MSQLCTLSPISHCLFDPLQKVQQMQALIGTQGPPCLFPQGHTMLWMPGCTCLVPLWASMPVLLICTKLLIPGSLREATWSDQWLYLGFSPVLLGYLLRDSPNFFHLHHSHVVHIVGFSWCLVSLLKLWPQFTVLALLTPLYFSVLSPSLHPPVWHPLQCTPPLHWSR